jgi:hypothetical protein
MIRPKFREYRYDEDSAILEARERILLLNGAFYNKQFSSLVAKSSNLPIGGEAQYFRGLLSFTARVVVSYDGARAYRRYRR